LPEIALNDLIYKLMTWVPSIYNDIEGLVYLEAITRTVNQAGLFSNYNSTLNFSSPKTEQGSIKAVYWDILVPIAIGGIEIDEDLLETLPKNRLNIMTIHQAKGLEYPLVIVDVGSDFAMNHWAQARFRYPVAEKLEHRLEDKLRQFSPTVFPARPALDRAFDDLYRLYYVAFSRAQDVLMLVGLSTSLDGQVPNIAAGWNREREHVWRNQFQRLKQSLNEQDGELLLI
jgi:DNA helicase-2/ATP-dependent DNA helicase PcrA